MDHRGHCVSLRAHFSVRREAHTTAIDLDARPGEVIGLIGPNGAGKSTTLRALAGLVSISSGSIELDGRILSGPGHHVPSHERNVGFVFQDHLLFPHLSALDNVAFGPRARGVRARESRSRAAGWLDRLDVSEYADRKPRELSGGQAQRVAIARALATDPAMLLLDEPTAALDAAGAMTLRTQLRRHLHEFAGISIIVTHTALDAMLITDRLVVVDGGEVVQTGSPADVAAHPRTDHVAALVGLNLVRGEATDGVLQTEADMSIVAAERLSGPAFVAFSPSAVSVYKGRPDGSPRNVWPGRVTSLAPHGDVVRLSVDVGRSLLADITPGALANLGLHEGSEVWLSVKATEVTVYLA
jgi:molybdate transport system ATP-binding protein